VARSASLDAAKSISDLPVTKSQLLIHRDDMESEGYGEYLDQVEEV